MLLALHHAGSHSGDRNPITDVGELIVVVLEGATKPLKGPYKLQDCV